jgi:hypothetical protein
MARGCDVEGGPGNIKSQIVGGGALLQSSTLRVVLCACRARSVAFAGSAAAAASAVLQCLKAYPSLELHDRGLMKALLALHAALATGPESLGCMLGNLPASDASRALAVSLWRLCMSAASWTVSRCSHFLASVASAIKTNVLTNLPGRRGLEWVLEYCHCAVG